MVETEQRKTGPKWEAKGVLYNRALGETLNPSSSTALFKDLYLQLLAS